MPTTVYSIHYVSCGNIAVGREQEIHKTFATKEAMIQGTIDHEAPNERVLD